MLVVIDESGCPGFKTSKGSTLYFVLAMVIFEKFSDAELVSAKITELRSKLKLKSEFKFSKTKLCHKDEFFNILQDCPFKIRAMVVNKKILYSAHLRTDKSSFYNFFVKNLLKYDGGLLADAIIKIDGSGDKLFKERLLTYLRQELGPGKIKKFSFADSAKDNLIQLADMVAGAIARSYKDNRADSTKWINALRKGGNSINIWEFR